MRWFGADYDGVIVFDEVRDIIALLVCDYAESTLTKSADCGPHARCVLHRCTVRFQGADNEFGCCLLAVPPCQKLRAQDGAWPASDHREQNLAGQNLAFPVALCQLCYV